MKQKPAVSIKKITFSGGNEILLGHKVKVIVVGPNNSGKSRALRDIDNLVRQQTRKESCVVREVVHDGFDPVSLKDFLNANASIVDGSYQYNGFSMPVSSLERVMAHGGIMGTCMSLFIKLIGTEERLTVTARSSNVAVGQPRQTPQQVLYENPEIMDHISNLFSKVFGKNLMIDYRGGTDIPIHVGELPDSDLVDRVGLAYVNKVRSNPLLRDQGDGMRSYAAVLFQTLTADCSITLIDEPEAFLHPPQMRRLGEVLASDVDSQLIVSTHSSNMLRGFLSGSHGAVRILRMHREGDKNFIFEAPPEAVRELWSRPSLRYSNALDSLFHDQAILCEDHSDCSLLNAVADHISEQSVIALKDTAYVSAGGKHQIPKIAHALRRVGVPVKAVFDIDILSARNLVAETVTAFGGDWMAFEGLWRGIDKAVRGTPNQIGDDEVRAEVIRLLTNSPEGIPKSDIEEALKQRSPWASLKRSGLHGLPNGQIQIDFRRLIDQLESIGIYVITIGQIENFCRHVGGHGVSFVTDLLSDISLDDPCLEELRQFTSRVHSGRHCLL